MQLIVPGVLKPGNCAQSIVVHHGDGQLVQRFSGKTRELLKGLHFDFVTERGSVMTPEERNSILSRFLYCDFYFIFCNFRLYFFKKQPYFLLGSSAAGLARHNLKHIKIFC